MKKTVFLLSFILFLFISACSSLDVRTDYDPDIDFNSYKTYSFFKGDGAANDPLAANPLVKKRVETGVEKSMTARGYKLVDAEDPDFVVILHAGDKEKTQITSHSTGGYGYGGYGYGRYGGGWGGYGGTQTDVYQYTETTLFVDIADFAKKELAWRGTATGVVKKYNDQKEMQEGIDEVLEKILADFPPKK